MSDYSKHRKDVLYDYYRSQSLSPEDIIIGQQMMIKHGQEFLGIASEKNCSYGNCVGYLNSENTCMLCQRQTCPDCEKELIINHICLESDLETVKMLKESSVKCPRCNSVIIKDEGCNDIWCVVCHCSFNFRDRRITPPKHNPELESYLEKQKTCQEFNWDLILGNVAMDNIPHINRLYGCYLFYSNNSDILYYEELYHNYNVLNKLMCFFNNDYIKEKAKKRLFDNENRYQRKLLMKNMRTLYCQRIYEAFKRIETCDPKGKNDNVRAIFHTEMEDYRFELNKRIDKISNILNVKLPCFEYAIVNK